MSFHPAIHPLLNYETIRCELRRYCHENETHLARRYARCRGEMRGPQQQLLDEDIRELRLMLRWLRYQVHTFHSTTRDEWMCWADGVDQEIRRVRSRYEALMGGVSRLASPYVNNSTAIADEDRNKGAGVEGEKLCRC